MGRKTFMVISWFWMAMAFDYFIIGNASSSTQPSSAYNFYTKYNNHEFNSTPIMDSELSGSERTRRLIPYMAFYLPPSEIPINQQYSIQKNRYSNNSIEQQPPPTAVESAGPEPSSDYITLPDYLKTSAIGETETTPIYNVQQQKQPRFRPIIYENQYTVPTNIKAANGNTQPILHLLPPGSAGRNGGSAFVGAIFRETHPSKHKTVQHFPPLKQHNELSQEHAPHPPQQQQQQQQEERQQQRFNEQPILYRQRLQPSKISFSPFTSSNAVPGHFVPIIYAPLRNSGKGDSSSNSNSKTINYNYDDSPVEQISQLQQHHHQQQQQQHQQYHHYDSSYKEVQQTQHQIMAEPNSLPPHVDATSSGKEAHLLYQQEKQQQQQYTQQQPQIDFIAIAGVTGPSSGGSTSTQSGPVYHIVKETSPSMTYSSVSPQHQPLLSLKSQKVQFRPSKHPHIHTSQPESFFSNGQVQPEQREQHIQQQPEQQQQQYFNINDLTPQEKYVLYLRQRIRYNKQQEQQQQTQNSQTTTKDRKQFRIPQYEQQQQQPLKSQANPDIFVYSTITSPVDLESDTLQQAHQHRPATELNEKNYSQHSLAPHAIYIQPQIAMSGNHEPTPKSSTKPLQQVLHIPVRTLLSEFDSLPKAEQNKVRNAQRYHVKQSSKYIDSYGIKNSQYMDEVVEDPKQALEEQYPQSIANQQAESPPQAAYIIITTAKPPYQGEISTQQQEYHLSTQRPFYKHPPTLRLKPITTQNTKYAYVTKSPKFMLSPTTPAPFRHNSVTKQYEVKYVTTPPNYVPMKTSPSPANKLRPAIQYEENSSMSTPTADLNQYPQNNYALEDPNQLPDIHTSSLSEILHKLQASNHLPKTLTADNIDNSIKTLITILNNLKKSQKIVVNPPQHHDPPPVPTDYDYSNGNDDYHNNEEHEITLLPPPSSSGPNKHPGPSTGRAGIDYPNYSVIPQTSFECTQQRYKGFFGDPETNCQVWHYCDLNGGKSSFLCPNGTIFSQIALTCDWWFNVKCSATSQLYVLNERLYKYILPFNPKFPEDYSGPLVDKYLAMKFQEMEEKMRLEKEKSAVKIEREENHIEETTISEDGTTISSEKTKQKIDEQSSERNLLTDDISEDLAKKSSYVAFESSTKQTTSQTDYENEPVSLSIKPIVVSSTIEPDLSNETSSKDEEQENQDSKKEQSDTNEHESFQRSPNVLEENNEKNLVEHQNESKLDSSKISVEKVEVIEIKSDGTSGHLTPNMFYADIDSKS